MCIPFSMGKGSSQPSTPKVAEAPKVGTEASKVSRKAGEDESKRAKRAQGRGSTILTSPFGAQEPATVRRKTLLGA